METTALKSCSAELLKIAKPRYEKEIEKGTISRAALPQGQRASQMPLDAMKRKATRSALAEQAPVAADKVQRSRTLLGKMLPAQMHWADAEASSRDYAKSHGSTDFYKRWHKVAPNNPKGATFPGVAGTYLADDLATGITMPDYKKGVGGVVVGEKMGPAMRQLSSGPTGKTRFALGQVIPAGNAQRLIGGKLEKTPIDDTLNFTTWRHELGEANSVKGKAQPFASHLGPKPILEEQQVLRRDPGARKVFDKIRQMSPDDARMQKYIRQMGGTPDAPLPVGGKHERALSRRLAKDVKKLDPMSRLRAMVARSQGAKVSYLPNSVSHAAKKLPKATSWQQAAPHAKKALKFLFKG